MLRPNDDLLLEAIINENQFLHLRVKTLKMIVFDLVTANETQLPRLLEKAKETLSAMEAN